MSTANLSAISQTGVWNFDPEHWTSEWNTDDYQWFEDHPRRDFLLRSPFYHEIAHSLTGWGFSVLVHGECMEKLLLSNPDNISVEDDLQLRDLWVEGVARSVQANLTAAAQPNGGAQ